MKVITSEKIPIKLWLNDIEDNALNQAKNLANFPFAFKHIAIMPDSHTGYGMPIGGVLATKDVIIPNAVGVDIGCGICAIKTNLKEIDKKRLKNIISLIRNLVPVGFKHHLKEQKSFLFNQVPDIEIIQKEIKSAKYQLGTLGGGNHFIEIQRGSDDFIWIMVHSGSRNFGLQIAKEYNKKAKKLCEKQFPNILDKDLSFLPLNTKDSDEYIKGMEFALLFAKENRFQIIEYIKKSFEYYINDFFYNKIIDIHHNYARMENHFNNNVIVHRKGTTSARKGEIGIIPGSQGTNSYIVEGLGNLESFMSCSHGAGRKMGRKQAQRELNLDNEIKNLNDQGIIHAIQNKKDLDEASGAYKDISIVMENQKDLVKPLIELTPLAIIKG